MKKFIKSIIVIIIFLYVGFGLVLFIFQKSLVYYPDKQDFNLCADFRDSEKLNLNSTRVYYKKNSEKLVIFYHGNAGSACMRAYLKDEFEKQGLSYLFVEYAGYSNDSNKPSKELLMKDVENVNQFIADKQFSKIIIAGESLGTALAVYHSSIASVDKLLLISPFYRMADMAKNNYGIYPISLMLTENYDSAKWIRSSQAKNIEIIHGSADEIVPIEQSRKLFNEARTASKKFVEVAGAHHNDIYNFDETYKNMMEFLSE